MSRSDAMANRILDALLTTLGTINSTSSPTEWLTTPKVVARYAYNFSQLPTPALVVSIESWGQNEPLTGGVHRANATVNVDCLVRFKTDVDDPTRDLHRLVADVLKAVQNDTQLGGVLTSGYIHVIDGYKPIEQLANVAGLAGCTLQLRAEWEWSATNP